MESYWTYELCHGKHLRQYHEEQDPKSENDKPLIHPEYYLGNYKEDQDTDEKVSWVVVVLFSLLLINFNLYFSSRFEKLSTSEISVVELSIHANFARILLDVDEDTTPNKSHTCNQEVRNPLSYQ